MKTVLALMLLIILAAGGCAPPAPAAPPSDFDTGIDPGAWVRVPAGEFLMGQHDHHTAIDYDYEIMVTPVTNAQYARYLNEALAAGTIKVGEGAITGYYPGDEFHGYRHEVEIKAGDWMHLPLDSADSRLIYSGGAFTVKPGYESHPVTVVTWFGARAYGEFYGYRLPTEAEWEKAARGPDGRPFPWGDEITPGNANYYQSHDPFEEIVGALGDTTPVGFYNGQTYDGFATLDSPSPYGLYDMAGNVWEWTADVYENEHYRYLRGGSKADYGYDLRVWTRNSAGPDYYSPSFGFRCLRETG